MLSGKDELFNKMRGRLAGLHMYAGRQAARSWDLHLTLGLDNMSRHML